MPAAGLQRCFLHRKLWRKQMPIILWLLGVPLGVVILLWLLHII